MGEEEEYVPTEEPVAEEKPKKENCLVVSEHIKPLLECCKDFEEGKIDEGTFFAKTLTNTGEFMQAIRKLRETKPSE